MIKFLPLAASALLASVALGAPAGADPPIYPPTYGSNGSFAVGTQTRDGLTAFIPPGRYRVDQSPGPMWKDPGFWLRCNAVPCAPTYSNHVIATGSPSPDLALMDILPSDTAVYLYNVTLTFFG